MAHDRNTEYYAVFGKNSRKTGAREQFGLQTEIREIDQVNTEIFESNGFRKKIAEVGMQHPTMNGVICTLMGTTVVVP